MKKVSAFVLVALLVGNAQAVQPEEARFQKVVAVGKSIQKAAREPESVKWDLILANDDASVICYGYGGVSKANAVYSGGKITNSAVKWNKNCASKPMNNMIHARQAM